MTAPVPTPRPEPVPYLRALQQIAGAFQNSLMTGAPWTVTVYGVTLSQVSHMHDWFYQYLDDCEWDGQYGAMADGSQIIRMWGHDEGYAFDVRVQIPDGDSDDDDDDD